MQACISGIALPRSDAGRRFAFDRKKVTDHRKLSWAGWRGL